MLRRFLIAAACVTIPCKVFSQNPGQMISATGVSGLISPPTGCSAEIRGNRPKVYIANFFVTYGKKDMGKAIGDYIAERFETDGRFEIIPRAQINETMMPFFKNKKATADQYLQKTLELAASQDADCVIFGRIAKKKNKISFLVRMAAVSTGNSVRKVDTDVEKAEAVQFLEGIGDSFVSYFVSAPALPVPIADKPGKIRGFYLAANGVGVLPFGFVRNGFSWGSGGSFEFGHKGLLGKDLFFGVNGEYVYYFKSNDNFTSLYSMTALGLAGYEFLTLEKLKFQLVLYGGYQMGRLTGAVETFDYGYGIFMAGSRAVYDLSERWGLMGEARYSLAIAGSTKISSVGFSAGGQWRF